MNAATYLVGTTRTFEAATDGEELVILDEDFTQIPGSYNDMKPATICPMLGYDTLDLFLSRAGWSTDVCMMFYLAENMPCMVLTNMYAAYGLPGTLMSPYADFSVAGGKVTVSGMAMSAAGEIVLHIGFMDADGNINNPQEVTFSEEPSQFEVEVEGGTENSCLAIRFADAEEDETMLAVFSLGASMNLNAGEKITLPYLGRRRQHRQRHRLMHAHMLGDRHTTQGAHRGIHHRALPKLSPRHQHPGAVFRARLRRQHGRHGPSCGLS